MADVATVMPRELRLGAPPTMPQARSYLFRQQSTLSSYSPSQTITINIPRLQRSYLRKDSYLRFTVDVKQSDGPTNSKIALDSAGAYGFFEKIEVFDYLGSTVLESISGAPQLAALLLDLGLETMLSNTVGNVSAGLSPEVSTQLSLGRTPFATRGATPTPTAMGSSINYTDLSVRPASSGIDLALIPTLLDPNDSCATIEFSIPWLSFLGLLSKKYVPLHNGFTIVLTLASLNVPMYQYINQSQSYTFPAAATTALNSAAVPTFPATNVALTWSVRDVYADCQILELGPEAEAMLLTSTQGQPLTCHTKSFRNYSAAVKGPTWEAFAGTATTAITGPTLSGPSEFNMNLNLNVASLTNILWFMRSNDHINNLRHQSIGGRTRNMLQRWYFQYGSSILPQSNGIQAMSTTLPTLAGYTATTDITQYPIHGSGFTECYQELIKSRYYSPSANRMNFLMYAWDSKYNDLLDPRVIAGAAAVQTETTCIPYLNILYSYLPWPTSPFGIGKFACGLNLELCNGKEGEIICGLNTNGMNTSIRGFFHPTYTNYMDPGGVRVDAYAEYDAFINISPGIASTVSF